MPPLEFAVHLVKGVVAATEQIDRERERQRERETESKAHRETNNRPTSHTN